MPLKQEHRQVLQETKAEVFVGKAAPRRLYLEVEAIKPLYDEDDRAALLSLDEYLPYSPRGLAAEIWADAVRGGDEIKAQAACDFVVENYGALYRTDLIDAD